MSSVVNPEDRATAVLFGDGAGTVLIEPVEDESVGILDHVCHMNGEGESSLYIPAGGSVEPVSAASVQARRHYVVQDGPAVYKDAVIGMAEVTEEILKRNDMTAADLAWLVPHQSQPAHHRGGGQAAGSRSRSRHRQSRSLRQYGRRNDFYRALRIERTRALRARRPRRLVGLRCGVHRRQHLSTLGDRLEPLTFAQRRLAYHCGPDRLT